MPTSFDLSGKIAMVTGASSGLGRRFARVLADNGAHVVLASRRVERLKELRADIEGKGGSATVVTVDVTSIESINDAVTRAEQEAGALDILINNSGVAGTQRLVDVTPEDYDHILNTNTRGAFFMAQAVAKQMIRRAKDQPERPTRIINIASMAALRVLPQIGVYCMSKAAVVQMTKVMALEWGRFGINVNALCPGYISTELNEHYWETEGGQRLIEMLPRKRLGKPEDLDGLLVLLCSERSGFINGSVIAADDGFGVQ